MAGKFIPYTTKPGDRWDTIANKAYGDATRYEEIQEANPSVPIEAELPGGLKLQIPIIDQPKTDLNNLPPWKR